MRKLLSTVSSLIILGTLSFSNQSALAGTDHLAAALLDAAEKSKPQIRALALQIVDEEAKSDIRQLVSDVVLKGTIQDGPHKGKKLLEIIPVGEVDNLFSLANPTITATPFTLAALISGEIDRTKAFPLVVSLHFRSQAAPDYSPELTLNCAGVTAKSTLTFRTEEVKPICLALLAGSIGMTSNDLRVSAEFPTHHSVHLQRLIDEIDSLRDRLEEAEAELQDRRHANSAGGSESRVAVYSISRERQMDLEAMGITHEQLEEMPSDLRTFFMVDPQNINSLAVAQAALEAGQTYTRDHLSVQNEDKLMKFQNAFYPRLVQLR